MAPVNVAKDVEFWLHAPDFLKESCAAEGKVAVEGLLCARSGLVLQFGFHIQKRRGPS